MAQDLRVWGMALTMMCGCGEGLVPRSGAAEGVWTASSAGGSEPTLLDHSRWSPLCPDQDPLAEHRPRQDDCPAASWREEQGALEVETGHCQYFSAAQPLPTPLYEGEALRVVLWHGDLVSADEGQGHVALLLDEQVLWETTVPIPSKAQVYDVELVVARAWPVDTTLTFHLHNHGFNAWKLLSLSRTRGTPAPQTNGESG